MIETDIFESAAIASLQAVEDKEWDQHMQKHADQQSKEEQDEACELVDKQVDRLQKKAASYRKKELKDWDKWQKKYGEIKSKELTQYYQHLRDKS